MKKKKKTGQHAKNGNSFLLQCENWKYAFYIPTCIHDETAKILKTFKQIK